MTTCVNVSSRLPRRLQSAWDFWLSREVWLPALRDGVQTSQPATWQETPDCSLRVRRPTGLWKWCCLFLHLQSCSDLANNKCVFVYMYSGAAGEQLLQRDEVPPSEHASLSGLRCSCHWREGLLPEGPWIWRSTKKQNGKESDNYIWKIKAVKICTTNLSFCLFRARWRLKTRWRGCST